MHGGVLLQVQRVAGAVSRRDRWLCHSAGLRRVVASPPPCRPAPLCSVIGDTCYAVVNVNTFENIDRAELD